MMLFPCLGKLADVFAVQRSHDSNPCHHRRAAAAAQHQRFNRRLPFREVGLLLRQLRDVVGRVLQRE